MVAFGQILNTQYIEACRDARDYRKIRVYNNALVFGDVKICGKIKLYKKIVFCDTEGFCNKERIFTYSHISYGVKKKDKSVSGKGCIDFSRFSFCWEFLIFYVLNLSLS
ncbi:hypothetical protein CEV08_02735 [Bartonella tribocorum]|uniref:Uncharacterized protein n=1 Tax=Bartonella tribocorum TaxID=85701 RepID=A0A2M6UX55_9HYPH|nr:hypothetical protein CEV08_02735 [Bartonella tribocorum]